MFPNTTATEESPAFLQSDKNIDTLNTFNLKVNFLFIVNSAYYNTPYFLKRLWHGGCSLKICLCFFLINCGFKNTIFK